MDGSWNFGSFKEKDKTHKKVLCESIMINKEGLKSNSKCCSEIIADARDKFLNRLSVKINDPNTLAKSYFSIINNFLNNKKIPATRQITA